MKFQIILILIFKLKFTLFSYNPVNVAGYLDFSAQNSTY
jgi:hypothetical protein